MKFKYYGIPVIVFSALLIHGATLGLSDDEAYYWVLAQHPSWGFAFHPPGVVWMIAAFQSLFQGLMRGFPEGLVRLPAVLSTALILAMGLNWSEKIAKTLAPIASPNLLAWSPFRSAGVILAFYSFFALSWMIVPDIPLFLGWTLLFTSVWSICFTKSTQVHSLGLVSGILLLILSKFSGILAVFSAFLSFVFWCNGRKRLKFILLSAVAVVIALVPILIWNLNHEWASILYQIRDRHGGGGISLKRYLKFWGIEFILVGPILIAGTFALVKRALSLRRLREGTLYQYVLVWLLPAAAVFCVQPLFSDFKPHWSFIVWWPAVLLLAAISFTSDWKWIRYHIGYGLFLGSFILLSCHLPLGAWIIQGFSRGEIDPRLDVTNDLHGWNQLEALIISQLGEAGLKIPIVGSRYQTASQAAFNLAGRASVSFIPREVSEKDEWENLQVTEGDGPAWPKLRKSILFVTDIRYDAPPQFLSSHCTKLARSEARRFNLVAKWIELWKCDPVY